MKKILIAILSIIMILISSLTVFAGDIPESLLHSEDAEIFFGEVIAYHPYKKNGYCCIIGGYDQRWQKQRGNTTELL